MKWFALVTSVLAAFAGNVAAVGVTGSAEGFAAGVTGGGTAAPVYPTTLAELVSYLGDSSPRVIIIQQTFDFTGSEGTTTGAGCAPWGTGAGCQTAIDLNAWCENYATTAPKITVTYDTAGILGITVASNKSLVGVGSSGIIRGKGLRVINGASNIIIQNILFEDLNPEYVWGGDALTIAGGDLIWIDHVTVQNIGRQMLVLGPQPSGRVSVTNSFFNGVTSYSATCDGYHYWGVFLDGDADLVTLKGNYFYHFSGRMPKVLDNTLLHAVNNYWYQSSGHAFEISAGGNVVVEGSVFQNVPTVLEKDGGYLFTSPSTAANTACEQYLGRACQINGFGSSGAFSEDDTEFFVDFSGKSIASAAAYTGVASSVTANAGYGKI